MNTIIVEIRLPASNQTFDFSLPVHRKVGALIPEIIDAIHQSGQVVPVIKSEAVLCCLDIQMVLNSNATVANQNIKEGATLMLI